MCSFYSWVIFLLVAALGQCTFNWIIYTFRFKHTILSSIYQVVLCVIFFFSFYWVKCVYWLNLLVCMYGCLCLCMGRCACRCHCSGSMLLLLLSCFSHVRLCVTPWTAAHLAPPSLGFSRQEHWSGLPFPSPVCESEKWKKSLSRVWLLVTLWTEAYPTPLSMGFSRQEYWNGLPLLSPAQDLYVSLI